MTKEEILNTPVLSLRDCAIIANFQPHELYKLFCQMWANIAENEKTALEYVLNGAPYFYIPNGEYIGNEKTIEEIAFTIAQNALKALQQAKTAQERKEERSNTYRDNVKRRWQK